MIQALLLAIWAGLCTWDQYGPHLGFRKPLLASVGVGIILGDMTTAIMIGAMFLILMGVIDLRIPGSYIVSFVVFIVLFGGHGLDAQYITAHLCGGGLMLGAWFMATDYVTSPITSSGKIIYGICMGLLTGLFRLFGGSAEGVSYAIIISNLLVPLIEKITLPKPFGKGGEK